MSLTDCVCGQGSAVFCHGDLWHGACDNHSSGTRRVIHLGFACPSTRPQYEIAGALPDATRALYPRTSQLAPFQNRWRVPANYKSEGITEATPPAAKTDGTDIDAIPRSGSASKYQEPVFTGDEAKGVDPGLASDKPPSYKNPAMGAQKEYAEPPPSANLDVWDGPPDQKEETSKPYPDAAV